MVHAQPVSNQTDYLQELHGSRFSDREAMVQLLDLCMQQ